jgi:Rod binding domain-containing protein
MGSNGILTGTGSAAEPDLQNLAARWKKGDKQVLPALARQFESLFTTQILKEMRQTLEPGGLFSGDNSDIYGGLFDQYLGKHLAQAGGLGLATMIQRQLDPSSHHSPSSAPTNDVQWQALSQKYPKPV